MFMERDLEKNFKDKNMTVVAERIFKDALDLLPVERAELIEKLFQTFDRSANSNVDAAWAQEGESRIDAYERGEIKASSVEDVFCQDKSEMNIVILSFAEEEFAEVVDYYNEQCPGLGYEFAAKVKRDADKVFVLNGVLECAILDEIKRSFLANVS